jgi:glycosyltransferase involved in cell wall biosynthesis
MVTDMASSSRNPVVIVVFWGQVVEDWLDPYNLTMDDMLRDISDGWLFGFIDALATVGVSTVPVLISRDVTAAHRRTHLPTGTTFWLLPPTQTWRALRRLVDNPYAQRPGDAAEGRSVPGQLAAAAAYAVLPWVSTPIRQLARTIREEHADVLLCQDYEYPTFDLCIARSRLLGVPVHAVFQGSVLQRTPLERFTRPFAIWGATGLIMASSSEADRVEEVYGVPDELISRTPNPILLDHWPVGDRTSARAALGIPTDAGVVSYHGRIEIAHKGLDILLDAWAQVTAERPDRALVLLITGTGLDAQALRAEIEQRQLRGIDWLDQFVLDRDVIQLRLAAADVSVLTSRGEGFAATPLEAMACGRPVVATDVRGIPELAPRGEADGVIRVPLGDAQAVAAAIGALLDDPERAAAVGSQARKRVEAFSSKALGPTLADALRLRHEPLGEADALRRIYEHRAQAWEAYKRTRASRTTQSTFRRARTKLALRIGRFLGVSDLSQSVADAHARLDAHQKELDASRGG